jgi:putative flippase GtrA
LSSQTLVRRIAQRRGLRQFVKFGIVGFSGLAVNFVIFTIIQHYTPKELQQPRLIMDNSIAFLSGGVSNYFLNRAWTFRSSGHAVKQGMQFIAVSVIALLIDNTVLHYVEPYLGPGHKSWFVATLSAIVVNFFVNKYWTFREPS